MSKHIKILEQFESLYQDSMDSAKLAALHLFREIAAKHGVGRARAIFAMWGNPPSKAKLATIKNHTILQRLDMMKPKPSVYLDVDRGWHPRC